MKNVLATFTIQDNGFEYFDYALFPRGMSNDAMLTKETEDVLRNLHIAF